MKKRSVGVVDDAVQATGAATCVPINEVRGGELQSRGCRVIPARSRTDRALRREPASSLRHGPIHASDSSPGFKYYCMTSLTTAFARE